jgi:hypothetical protein
MVHITQLDNDLTNDCGPSAIAQGVYLLIAVLLTIRAVVTRIGNPNQFTTVAQFLSALKHYGVPSAYEGNATWEWYKRMLDERRVIFALVDYDQFSDNPLKYFYAHWMTVIGYDATHVIAHDSLRRTGPTRFPIAEFIRAINTPSQYIGGYNRPNQAIVTEAARKAPVPTLASRISAVAREVRVTADELRKAG